MSGKILYLECFSGISGDMTVASLLDLGADQKVLIKALESLKVPGYEISIGRRQKCGIDACSFDVHLTNPNEGYRHSHEPEHSHHHSHEHHHPHGHEPEHSHHHGHEHHHHRNIKDIYAIIDRLDSNERVKTLSRKMFDIVAAAEAKAHNRPIDEVHFHEVGAIDSIVDIISTAVLIDNLDITEVVVSQLYEGQGHVWCQHGIIPVPVPAVVNITSAHGLSLRLTDNDGEMVTPTGAAIAAALKTRDSLPSSYKIVQVGLGAGKKDFKRANLLRAMLITDDDVHKEDEVWVLESNIDDCTGEALGYTFSKLMAGGALDAYHSPVYMKKNRPGLILGVICNEKDIPVMEDIIFTHTTTAGIRKYPVKRRVLEREVKKVQTIYGQALVKVCRHEGQTFYYPEYESVKAICENHSLSFQTVYQLITGEAAKELN